MGAKKKIAYGIVGGTIIGATTTGLLSDKFKEIMQLVGIALIFIVVLFLISKF